jgi:hypothetical protein
VQQSSSAAASAPPTSAESPVLIDLVVSPYQYPLISVIGFISRAMT